MSCTEKVVLDRGDEVTCQVKALIHKVHDYKDEHRGAKWIKLPHESAINKGDSAE